MPLVFLPVTVCIGASSIPASESLYFTSRLSWCFLLLLRSLYFIMTGLHSRRFGLFVYLFVFFVVVVDFVVVVVLWLPGGGGRHVPSCVTLTGS